MEIKQCKSVFISFLSICGPRRQVKNFNKYNMAFMLVSNVLTGLKLYLNHKYLFELIFRNIVYKLQAEAVKSNHFLC